MKMYGSCHCISMYIVKGKKYSPSVDVNKLLKIFELV